MADPNTSPPPSASHPSFTGPVPAHAEVRRDTEEILGRALDCDADEADRLMDEVIQAHLPLVLSLASRYRDRGESWDDLVQVAGLGLVLAVQRFRPTVGAPFLAYAIPTILGELRRHLRDHAWAVKPPRRLQELRPVVLAAQEQLTQRLGRLPSVSEVAAEADACLADVIEALTLASAYRPDSIEALGLGPGATADVLTAPATPLSDVELRLSVAPALADLPRPAAQAVHLYYVESRSQREIADRIGVSQMQVSRLLRNARACLSKIEWEPPATP